METDFLTDKTEVRRAFNRAAASYDAAAVLQREVSERMLSRLDYMKINPGTVLDAGSGTGNGARALQNRYRDARVVEFDLAHSMLQQSRGELPWWRRFGARRQICGDIERLPLKNAAVDLVWSNLALQWCNDLDGALHEIHRVLSRDGLFLFSTFGPDTLRELRRAFAGSDRHVHVNRFVDMHDIGDALVNAGFSTPVMDMEYITLTYSDVKSVMRDLKAIGAHNAMLGRPRGLFGKDAWQRVLDNYELLRQDGRLPATFEVVYGHAWKPEPRTTADGAHIVKFAQKK